MLRIGIVGAGRIAQIAHLAAIADVAEAHVVAIADLRPVLARMVAERWQIPRVHASHEELIADPQIDAVIVVTQRSQTAAIARAALCAGKHVLSEKPMALSTRDARDNIELAHERGRIYAIGYMKRYDRGVQAARDVIARWTADGSAGALLGMQITHHGGDDQAGSDWVMSNEARTDGGFSVRDAVGDPTPRSAFDQLLNVFSHTTNLARYLLGESFRWSAGEVGARSAAFVGASAHCPVTGSFVDRVIPGWHEQVAVSFERGSVTVALPAPFDRAGYARVRVAHPSGASEDCSRIGWAFALQARAFAAAVTRRRAPAAAADDAVEDVALAESFWRLAVPVGA